MELRWLLLNIVSLGYLVIPNKNPWRSSIIGCLKTFGCKDAVFEDYLKNCKDYDESLKNRRRVRWWKAQTFFVKCHVNHTAIVRAMAVKRVSESLSLRPCNIMCNAAILLRGMMKASSYMIMRKRLLPYVGIDASRSVGIVTILPWFAVVHIFTRLFYCHNSSVEAAVACCNTSSRFFPWLFDVPTETVLVAMLRFAACSALFPSFSQHDELRSIRRIVMVLFISLGMIFSK